MDQPGVEGFPTISFVVSEEAVEAEACIDGSEPSLANFSVSMSLVGVGFMLNAPLASDFPDKVYRL